MSELSPRYREAGAIRGSTQNANGKAHYAFYEPNRRISFIWAGSPDEMIEVCYEGYGEPVYAEFHATQTLPVFAEIRPLTRAGVKIFQKICEKWLAEHPKESWEQ